MTRISVSQNPLSFVLPASQRVRGGPCFCHRKIYCGSSPGSLSILWRCFSDSFPSHVPNMNFSCFLSSARLFIPPQPLELNNVQIVSQCQRCPCHPTVHIRLSPPIYTCSEAFLLANHILWACQREFHGPPMTMSVLFSLLLGVVASFGLFHCFRAQIEG